MPFLGVYEGIKKHILRKRPFYMEPFNFLPGKSPIDAMAPKTCRRVYIHVVYIVEQGSFECSRTRTCSPFEIIKYYNLI